MLVRRIRATYAEKGHRNVAPNPDRTGGDAVSEGGKSKNHCFAARDRLRLERALPYLKGRGTEIGPGSYPALLPTGCEAEYFDKRPPEEMARYMAGSGVNPSRMHSIEDWPQVFPEGADFVLCHNVLEHIPNPVKALLEWHGLVKFGGVAVVSVPEVGNGPDRYRLPVSLEHVLHDFLFERDGTEFESREHAYSALCGFNKGTFKDMAKIEQAQITFETATNKEIISRDIHWHVHSFTPQVFVDMVEITAALGNRAVDMLSVSTASHEDEAFRNEGEIILVYRLGATGSGKLKSRHAKILKHQHSKMENARKKLDSILAAR
jgi:SAM-dependent methyltransferase